MKARTVQLVRKDLRWQWRRQVANLNSEMATEGREGQTSVDDRKSVLTGQTVQWIKDVQ